MHRKKEDIGIVDLASNNQDLKNNIAIIFTKLETMDLSEVESQVSFLMTNMMDFFAKQVEEIPSFDSLTPEQQKILLQKFKKVAHKLKHKKIKTIDEMLQTFVFTVLSNIEEKYVANEVLNNKFKSLVRNAASHDIYKITNEEVGAKTAKERDFINESVLLEVKKALKNIGLELHTKDLNINPEKTDKKLKHIRAK